MAKKKKKIGKNIQTKRARRKTHSKSSNFQSGNPFEWAFEQTKEIECLVPVNIFKSGMGNVVFARKLKSDSVLMAMFLLDTFCLGIKNSTDGLISAGEYFDKISRLDKEETVQSVSPACCRKLVEGAEAYARELGFLPHKDFKRAKNIFGNTDPDECETEFTFGRDGKPCYISGPYDSQLKQNQIVRMLEKKLGPDGYDYIKIMPDDEFNEFED